MSTHVANLCWDCANAVLGCSWSKRFIPVKGWDAEEIPATERKPYSTYIVKACPQFKRDAYYGGQSREPITPKKRKE